VRSQLVLAACLAACGDRTPPEIGGLGKYVFNKTTVADVQEGRCEPTEVQHGTRKVTWCYGLPSYTIANRAADLHLYFGGVEPTAQLIEIQVTISGCVEADLEAFMRKAFGMPVETKATRAYWQNSILWAAAVMPSEPGRCRLHLLPLSEQAEIARLRAVR
jgi:hypothetical protein